MAETCKTCKDLLSAGLDLCVRARGLDAQFRRDANLSASVDGEAWVKSGRFDEHVRRHNIHYPDQSIAPKSATIHLWVQEQYDTDLAAWERNARHHLTQGCDKPKDNPND